MSYFTAKFAIFRKVLSGIYGTICGLLEIAIGPQVVHLATWRIADSYYPNFNTLYIMCAIVENCC